MTSPIRVLVAAAAFLALSGAIHAQASLKVGDPAPPLAQGKYVKGEPVEQFQEGTVYVVEFWATWCGPCIMTIPHVSALQEKYADQGVIFIGQDVWEEDTAQVAGFVEEMGDKMNYRVALDDVADGGKGKMAETWMEAAGQDGIPCAFIVDRAGQIAWIGHPMQMDGPLERIVAGTFDVKAESARSAKQHAAQEKMAAAAQSGNADEMLAAIEQVSAEIPEAAGPLQFTKFQVLLGKKDYAAAYAAAAKAGEHYGDNPDALNQIAWTIVDTPGLEQRDLDLAIRLANRANELTDSARGDILDTVARVHFEKGDLDTAIEFQTKAVDNAPNAQLKDELQRTLDEYKAKKG